MNKQSPTYFKPGFSQNQEECEIDDLHVTGTIPNWLEGDLIRNGPGIVELDKPMNHWFDGLAMLHKFSISNGKVSYKSKCIDCKAYKIANETGLFSYSDFATDPNRSMLANIFSVFHSDANITDSAKVNIAKVGDKLMALGEPLRQTVIDPQTLESIGVFDFGKNPRGRMTTAHPHTEGANSYNLVIEYGLINYYCIYSMTPEVRKITSVPIMEPSYLHSFGMSKRYFIITEFPLVVQSLKLALRTKPFIENFKWKPQKGSRFLVIDRETGEQVAKIKTDAFFSYHHVNAFEVDNKLIVDLVTYKDANIVNSYYKSELSKEDQKIPFGQLERFALDLKKQKVVSRKLISKQCIELPHFDYCNYNTNPNYQFVYGCGINSDHKEGFYNQLLKIDIYTGKHNTWYVNGNYPGEPIFVPNPNRKGEDDGVLLSVVLDAEKKHSFLLILEAKTMNELARVDLPHTILFGYHGMFNSRNKNRK